jgi:AAA+ superfamily predicted ATPase
MDPKTALRTQLDLAIREAWIEYQSNADFRKAWDQASYAWEPRMEAMKEEVIARYEKEEPGAKPSDDYVAETLRHISDGLLAEPPNREAFVSDFGDQICILLGWLLFPSLYPDRGTKWPSSSKESRLNELAGLIGSLPEYPENQARLQLLTITGLVREWGYTPLWNYRPDQLEALLTKSGLRHGYLRPILFVVAVSWVTLSAELSLACRGGLHSLKTFFLGLDIPRNDLTDTVREICGKLNILEFRTFMPERAVAVFEEMLCGQADTRRALSHEDADAVASSKKTNVEKKLELLGLDDEIAAAISELTEMVGLNGAKNEIIALAKYIKVSRMRQVRGLKQAPISLHLIFTGNPGTGKTTVARAVARLYRALGVLSKGHLVEVDRGGLVSQYVGGTAIKTKEAVESALDGVLFVDEAYSLHKETSWGDVGSEAVETLLKLMEDNRDRLAVIVAGYTDKMADFIASNPGLQSRFTRKIEFDDYTADEMLQIFERNAADNSFEIDPDARQTLLDHFQQVEGDSGFGNGRGVRNTFEAVIVAHANRIAAMSAASDHDLTLIVREDIELAIKKEHLEKI